MEFAKVACLLRLTQNGNVNNLSVPKAGVDAIVVTEIPLLRAINDIEAGGDEDCCVSEVRQVDVIQSSNAREIERLCQKYGKPRVMAIYPGGRGLPKTLEDCELPATAMAQRKPKAKAG